MDPEKFFLKENVNYGPKDFKAFRVVKKNDSTRYKIKIEYAKYSFFVKFHAPSELDKGENPELPFPKKYIPIFEYSFKHGPNAGNGTKKFLCWIKKEVIHRVAPTYYWDITGKDFIFFHSPKII